MFRFATLDGALGYVLPLGEKQAKRLAAISNFITREMRWVHSEYNVTNQVVRDMWLRYIW